LFEQKEGYPFVNKAILIPDFNNIYIDALKNIGTHGNKINVLTLYYMLKNIIHESMNKPL